MSSTSRRNQMIVIGAFAVVLVAVLIAVSAGGSDDEGGGDPRASGRESATLFDGIEQQGTLLGDPNAPATLMEFADLQCPFCAEFSQAVLPTVVEDYVRTGELRLDFQTLTFIGPDSLAAARMAHAAGLQDRLWEFVDAFYANQGAENSGYADEGFLTEIGGSIPGLDVDQALADRESAEVDRVLAEAEQAAERFGVDSTPSFVLTPRGGEPQPLELSSLEPGDFAASLDAALGASG